MCITKETGSNRGRSLFTHQTPDKLPRRGPLQAKKRCLHTSASRGQQGKTVLDNHNISYYNVKQQHNINYENKELKKDLKKQKIERASEGSLRFFVLPASLSLVKM